MKEVSRDDVLDNYIFWNRANLISDMPKNKRFTLRNIAEKVGDSISNSYFRAVINFLYTNKFLEIDKSLSTHLYTIKSNELSWFLIEGKIGKQIKKNFNNRMVGIKIGYLGY